MFNNTPVIVRHNTPKYKHYVLGTFSTITQCTSCKTIALKEDAHPADPCKHCGNTLKEIGAGKWIPPTSRWKWFKQEIVTPGYWELPIK